MTMKCSMKFFVFIVLAIFRLATALTTPFNPLALIQPSNDSTRLLAPGVATLVQLDI